MDATNPNINTVGRFKVHSRTYGNASSEAPPIVVVNGARQSMASWKSFILRFKDKYRIVLFDFPGQGRSEVMTGDSSITLEEQSNILNSIIDNLPAREKVNIFASSWGGAVAANYAAKNSSKINKLILASFGLSANRNMVNTIESGQAAIESGNPHLCGEIIINQFGHNIPVNLKNQIMRQFQVMSMSNVSQFYAHISRSLVTDLTSEIAFRDITAQTLAVNGQDDPIIDCDSLSYLETVMPSCERKVIRNAGHFLHLENVAILDVYRAFYDRQECDIADCRNNL